MALGGCIHYQQKNTGRTNKSECRYRVGVKGFMAVPLTIARSPPLTVCAPGRHRFEDTFASQQRLQKCSRPMQKDQGKKAWRERPVSIPQQRMEDVAVRQVVGQVASGYYDRVVRGRQR